MGLITTAIYESLNMDEDFQDEILDSLEETDSLQEEVSLKEERTAWDILTNAMPELLKESAGSLKESLLKEDIDVEGVIDEFYDLMMQDIRPNRAKKMVLQNFGKDSTTTLAESMDMKESASEEKSLSREERRAKRKSDYMKSVCEEFRKSADFFLDEQLDDEKLKYEGWRIKNLAVRKGIPHEDIREALLKENK